MLRRIFNLMIGLLLGGAVFFLSVLLTADLTDLTVDDLTVYRTNESHGALAAR